MGSSPVFRHVLFLAALAGLSAGSAGATLPPNPLGIFFCRDILSTFTRKPVTPAHLQPWLGMKPADLVPAEYLEKVTTSLRPLKLHAKVGTSILGGIGIDVELFFHDPKIGQRNFIEFRIYRGKGDRVAVLEELSALDPTRSDAPYRIGDFIKQEGLPIGVFRHVRDRVFAKLAAGGFETVRAESSQTLAVYQTYRRVVGMSPAGDAAIAFAAFVDETYASLRALKALRGPPIRSIADFSALLGTIGGWPITPATAFDDFFHREVREAWRAIGGDLDLARQLGITVHVDAHGRPILIEKHGFRFVVAHFLPKTPILDWRWISVHRPEWLLLGRAL